MADAHLYRATLRPIDIDVVDGTPVTSVARTIVDLGRHLPAAAAVVAADAALHDRLTTFDGICDVLTACWNWAGIRRAQRMLARADGRGESPLESISRLAIAAMRLPRPDLQPRIFDVFASFIARCDFYWDEFGVAGEADGRDKYDDRAVLWREKERQEALEQAGVVVVRWS